MAKSVVLYGVFLGAFISFCCYVTGVDVTGIGYEVLGDRACGVENYAESASSSEPSDINYSASDDLIRNKIKRIYSAEIGVREETGNNDGERVEEYLAITQLGTGHAWCAAFVSFVFSEAGFPQPRTPWSPALFPKDRVIWERGREGLSSAVLGGLKPHTPADGDVFGIYFANLKRIAHVGFVDEWGDKHVITVEGNASEIGGNEGDGVYRKRRPIASIYQVANWIDLEDRNEN